MNDFLEKLLKKKDKDAGLDGNYLFLISAKIGGEWNVIIGVTGLAEKAARVLFDQFDEANVLYPHKNGSILNIRIQIILEGNEIDVNYLPNAFSVS